jgi:hypothetical protein
MNKLRAGVMLLVAAFVDTVLIHYTTWMHRDTPWPWVFSLLLPILFMLGCLLVGKGLGERKEVVYDYRHGHAPDSERNVR